MKLKSFRIENCFGFKDSGWTSFSTKTPSNLFYIIGRNSSGKSTLLNAIRNFEYDLIPEKDPSFKNYKDIDGEPKLSATFSITKKDISVKKLIDDVTQNLLLETELTQEMISNDNDIQIFLSSIKECYTDFYNNLQSEILIERLKDGSYIFQNQEEYNERIKKLTEQINLLFNTTQGGQQALRKEHSMHILNFGAKDIESQLFCQFPKIYFFDKNFDLTGSLPNEITLETISSYDDLPESTKTFLDFLGLETVKQYLNSSDQDLHKQLEDEFNKKLKDLLPDSVFKFLEITVRRDNGLQITTRIQNQSSFFDHLSDNTKFLFNYYLYAKVNKINNDILLFDEPNNGFHATAQLDLLKYLKKLANDNTVIISTHSEYMIDYDLLENIRRMGKDTDNQLLVHNDFRNEISKKGEYLSLQPIAEAIGLKYGNQLKINDHVIIVEGLSDLYYINTFYKLVKGKSLVNLLPCRGDSSMLTIIPFVISQALSFKVILDTNSATNYADIISKDYGVDKKSIYTIPTFKTSQASGIEDIFSKNDFKKYVLGVDFKPSYSTEYSIIPNSEFVKTKKYDKKALAYKFSCLDSKIKVSDFEKETIDNVRKILSFIDNKNSWNKVI